MIVEDFFFSLTDPAEDVVLNGKIGVSGSSMNGSVTYSIVQPPDSLYYYGSFVLKGEKN